MEKENRTIIIQLGDETWEVELLWDKAPNICKAIWSCLPQESFATGSKVCSNEIMFMLPLVMEGENMEWPRIGDVGWFTKRSQINIWYNDPGPLGPLGRTALFGRVTKNLKGIEKEADRIWTKPGAKIRITKKMG
jgi:hypothetical protein